MSDLTPDTLKSWFKRNLKAVIDEVKDYVDTHGGGGGGGGSKPTATAVTLSAANWSNSTYSFETQYPSSTYDIVDILPNESTTAAQRNAWIAADCGGYYTTNIIVARGTVPTIDLPLTLLLLHK